MKLQTVNIVENADGQLTIHAFHETAAGNKKAEKLFKKIAMEHGMSESSFEFFLDNGLHECGTYSVAIVHTNC